MNRPFDADMPGLWDRVAERIANPSPDFYLYGGPWDTVLDMSADDTTFTLHFPLAWPPKSIAETAQAVMTAAAHAAKPGHLTRAEALRAALAYVVSVSGYVALAVGPVKGTS